MSTLQPRLSGVTDTIAHLNAQIRRMGNNDLPWVISYLTGRTCLIWRALIAGGWEILRKSKPLGIKMTGDGFQSDMAAQFAGKRALADFLADVLKEEKRK